MAEPRPRPPREQGTTPLSLFGQIRGLSPAARVSVLDRIKRFLAHRAGKNAADRAIDLIFAGAKNDQETLEALRALVSPPRPGPGPEEAPRAPPREAKPKGAPPAPKPLSLSLPLPPMKRLQSLRAAWVAAESRPAQESGPAAVTREDTRLRDVGREMAILKREAGRDGFAYLDLGCSEGRLTGAVARELGLPPDRAHGCDIVPQRAEGGPPAFTFAPCEPRRLPYADGSFDFVSLFMSAHHFEDAPAMLGEIQRVTRVGARVIMREHDCGSQQQGLFYDFVHAFYACLAGEETTPAGFAEQYGRGGYAQYRPRAEWLELFRRAGFEPDAAVAPHGSWIRGEYKSDGFDSFYAFLVRVAGSGKAEDPRRV